MGKWLPTLHLLQDSAHRDQAAVTVRPPKQSKVAVRFDISPSVMCFGYRDHYHCQCWQAKDTITLSYLCEEGKGIQDQGKDPLRKCPFYRYTPRENRQMCRWCREHLALLEPEVKEKVMETFDAVRRKTVGLKQKKTIDLGETLDDDLAF